MARKGNISRERKGKDSIERPVRWRKYQQIYLVVCEDEKTEPFYFDSFKNAFPEEVFYLRCIGTGRDALGVVESAIAECQKLTLESKKEVDFVWAVFDKDDLDLNESRRERFNKAFQIAKKNNIHVAMSNEAFELWLLLHLTNIDSRNPIPRSDLYLQLEEQIRKHEMDMAFSYKHGDDTVIRKVSQYGNEQLAIQRAKTLEEKFTDKDPILANPSTLVYKLVVELRAFIEFHNWKRD
ncbi:MAG: RloB family protein [Bacteroidia bacterium]